MQLRRNRELTESLTTSTLTRSRPRSFKPTGDTRVPLIPAIAFVVAFYDGRRRDEAERDRSDGTVGDRPISARDTETRRCNAAPDCSPPGAPRVCSSTSCSSPPTGSLGPKGRFFSILVNSAKFYTILPLSMQHFPAGIFLNDENQQNKNLFPVMPFCFLVKPKWKR